MHTNGTTLDNPGIVTRHRACQECNRKKTKCDMQRPCCGLCQRRGRSCAFPTKRKQPEPRKLPNQSSFQQKQPDGRIDLLLTPLESKGTDDELLKNLTPSPLSMQT